MDRIRYSYENMNIIKLDYISRQEQRENLYKKSTFLLAFGLKKHSGAILQKR